MRCKPVSTDPSLAQTTMPRGGTLRLRRHQCDKIALVEILGMQQKFPEFVPLGPSMQRPHDVQDALRLLATCQSKTDKICKELQSMTWFMTLLGRNLLCVSKTDMDEYDEDDTKGIRNLLFGIHALKDRLREHRIWNAGSLPLEAVLIDETHHRIPYKKTRLQNRGYTKPIVGHRSS